MTVGDIIRVAMNDEAKRMESIVTRKAVYRQLSKLLLCKSSSKIHIKGKEL